MVLNRFYTYSLRQTPQGDQVAGILQTAMQAVDPFQAVMRAMRLDGNLLICGDRTYHLNQYHKVVVVGFGKASAAMAQGVGVLLGDRIQRGAVIAKHVDRAQLARVPAQVLVLQGDHPVPGENSRASTRKLLEVMGQLTERDLLICLISGGGSALFTDPYEDIALEDLQKLTRLLLSSGAEIGEINALRKHLDRVKGGGLVRLAAPAEVITLILSDVIGSPLDVIASGPTTADSSTFAQAGQILQKYDLVDRAPKSIVNIVHAGRDGKIPETLKDGDPLLERVHNLVIADNHLSAQAAVGHACALGWNAMLLTTYLQGEAQQAGMVLGSLLRQIADTGEPLPRPVCIVAGGETTVTIRGNGLGGRNQELALGAVTGLAGLERVMLVALATDGEDGPTDAAGAVVTGETLARGNALGMNPAAYLARNDSYPYFDALGDLLLTGPSGTNVNDLTFLIAW